MLQFKMGGVLLQVDFIFLTLTAVLFLFFNDFAIYLTVAIFIHEFIHIFAMKCCGVKIFKIHFSSGVIITPKSERLRDGEIFLIAISAPIVNFLLALIFINTPFGVCNFSLGLLNIMPSKGFDGGTALGVLFKDLKILTAITVILLIFYMLINGFNIFAAIMIFFIFIENV
jgi:hypothetical protein